MGFDWDMFSAIGVWAGAIATTSAVVVALRQSRMAINPKLKVRVRVRENRNRPDEIDGEEYTGCTTEILASNIGLATSSIVGTEVRRFGCGKRFVKIDEGYGDVQFCRMIGPGDIIGRNYLFDRFYVPPGGIGKSSLFGVLNLRRVSMSIVEASGKKHRVEFEKGVTTAFLLSDAGGGRIRKSDIESCVQEIQPFSIRDTWGLQ